MRRPNLRGVGLTAHYTAKAWHALGVPEADRFVTRRGRLLFAATAPLRWLGPHVGLDDPLYLLLASRHLILEHELRAHPMAAYVELAAGLSPRGAARTRDPMVTYVEVDQPHVVARKRQLLGPAQGSNLHLLGGDATRGEVYDEVLALVEGSAPVAVIVEGLNSYLPRPALEALLAEVARLLRAAGGGMLLMDVNTVAAVERFGRLGRAVQRVIAAVARSPVFLPIRDEADARSLLARAGFESVTLHDPATHPATRAPRFAACRGVVLVAEAWIRGPALDQSVRRARTGEAGDSAALPR